MKPDTILVRFGELITKKRNRARFEQTVLDHIQRLLAAHQQLTYTSEFGRIYIGNAESALEPINEALNKVFGIHSYSPAYTTPLDVRAMQQKALSLVKLQIPEPRTFKISVRRANKEFPHDSFAMNDLIGGFVLDSIPALKVDVRKPDLDVRVEIRGDKALLYTKVEQGTGGYPLGTNGRGLLLLSGGIDSPVAGWYALRKGLQIEAVHFHSYPFTSERAKQKVIDLARVLSEYAGEVKLHLVPFTDIQTQLNAAHKGNFMVTFMRRAMYRIAERLADKHGLQALVTGESLGQVASQTLSSMSAIGRVVQMPILQPLVMMDKNEIIRVAEKIGTYELSILPYEDCCTLFLPKSPATNPNLRVLENMEKAFGFMDQAIDEAVEHTETLVLKPDRQTKTAIDHLF